MNQDERLKRIAEAAYYRAERRGFTGDYQLEDWLAAEREFAALKPSESEPRDTEQGPAAPAEENRGIPAPSPLAREERIRTEEIKQSAQELSVASERSAETGNKRTGKRAPATKKGRKQSSAAGAELRRGV